MFIVISLFSVSVLALSPTPEQDCCLALESGDDEYFEMRSCSEFNLNEEKCEHLVKDFRSAQDEFRRSAQPEYACCTYLGRDEEALEIFSEEFVLETCPAFNLNEEKCFAIMYGFDYPEEEFDKSTRTNDTLYDDEEIFPTQYIIISVIVVLLIVWYILKKRKK